MDRGSQLALIPFARLCARRSARPLFFLSAPAAYSYSFRSMPDALALDRIAVGEIDFAGQRHTLAARRQRK